MNFELSKNPKLSEPSNCVRPNTNWYIYYIHTHEQKKLLNKPEGYYSGKTGCKRSPFVYIKNSKWDIHFFPMLKTRQWLSIRFNIHKKKNWNSVFHNMQKSHHKCKSGNVLHSTNKTHKWSKTCKKSVDCRRYNDSRKKLHCTSKGKVSVLFK